MSLSRCELVTSCSPVIDNFHLEFKFIDSLHVILLGEKAWGVYMCELLARAEYGPRLVYIFVDRVGRINY